MIDHINKIIAHENSAFIYSFGYSHISYNVYGAFLT
jgi:hypothetical protein